MSARFGRNQRRRAREALASAQVAAKQFEATNSTLRRERNAAESEVRRLRALVAVHTRQMNACRRVLGDSIALPPVEHVVDRADFKQMVESGWRVPVPGPRFLAARPHELDSHPLEQLVQKFEANTEDAIEGGIELLSGGLHERTHAYVTTRQGAILYRVNIESLAQIDRPEALARITDLLAHSFMEDLEQIARRKVGRTR